MTRTARIVVGLDEDWPTPLGYALAEANRRKVALRLVHAWPILAPPFGEAGNMANIEPIEEAAHKLIDDALDLVHSAGVEVDCVVRPAAPLALLMEQEPEADEFVLGHNELPWIERIFSGTVSGGLMRTANCPVLVVPDDWDPTVTRDGGVVVTIHGDSDSEALLEYGFTRAAERSSKVTVLHVVAPGTLQADIDHLEEMLAVIIAKWSKNYPAVEVERQLVESERRAAILEATKDAELLVVGRPNSKLARFALVRPLVISIAQAASCPVAAIPH